MIFKLIVSCIMALTCLYQSVDCLQLKKVLVLSRHNIRTPLHSKDLQKYFPKKFPKWSGPPGELTPKGALLERNMGEYFSTWLEDKKLFSAQEKGTSNCPYHKSVYIFANSIQRTIETAKAFTKTAFPNCKYNVNFNHTTYPSVDLMFIWMIKNNTDAQRMRGEQEMREKLERSHLQETYAIMNNISDIKNADVCKNLKVLCDFVLDKDNIIYEAGSPPSIRGRFAIAKAMVDAFVMSFYDGNSPSDVAWDQILTNDQWKTITKILKTELDVRFNLTFTYESVKPFIRFLKKEFDGGTKFSFVCGHDATFQAVSTALGIKPFVLPEQFEPAPIGAKLVFQKWFDGSKDFMKVELVYLSWTQIRDAVKLSAENPPKKVSIFLKSCVADENGFCPWSDFEKIINDMLAL